MAEDKRWQLGDVIVLRYVETTASVPMVHAVMGDPAGVGGGAGQPFLVAGEVVTVQARPYRVVSDTGSELVLYQPEDTQTPRWLISEQRYLENPSRSRGETVRILYSDRSYDVTLFFETANPPPWFYDALFNEQGLQAGWRERRDQFVAKAEQTPRSGKTAGRFRGWYVNVQTPFRRMPYGVDITDLTLDIIVRPDYSWYWKDVDEIERAVQVGACSEEMAASIWRAGEDAAAMIEARQSPFDDEWINWRPPPGWQIDTIPDGWQFAPALLTD